MIVNSKSLSRSLWIDRLVHHKLGKFLVLSTFLGLSSSLAFSQVSVSSTAGTTSGTYTTVNAAFTAINAGTHQGAITLTVTANTTEPATPVPLLRSDGTTANYTSILIKPSGNVTINSAATPITNRGIIELQGADNVTIDGDDPATAGIRNLSIVAATSTVSGVACIKLSSNSTTGTDGADNVTIKNCIITGTRSAATNTTTNYGIHFSNGSAATGGAYASINTLIQNNIITRAYHGVYAHGVSTTYPLKGLQILSNIFGTSASGYSDATSIGSRSISLAYTATATSGGSAIIRGNDIRGGGDASYSGFVVGVYIDGDNYGLKIDRNNIHELSQPSSAGYGPVGIYGATTSNMVAITNNFISGFKGYTYSTAMSSWSTFGIDINAAFTDLSIDNNSIAINGSYTGTTANFATACIVFRSATAVAASIRNNILLNTANSTAAYGIYCTANANISNALVNNNCYYTPNGRIGYYNSTAQALLSGWQSATGKDNLSINENPPFVTATDLHLSAGSNTFLESGGVVVPTTNVDIDGQTRPGVSTYGYGTAPDIGADEFDGKAACAPLVATNTVSSQSTPICSGESLTFTLSTPQSGAGIKYQWQSSANGTSFTNIANAVNSTYTTVPATKFYRCKIYCSNGLDSIFSTPFEVQTVANILSITSAQRCGAGSVILNATANTGSIINWYDVATGGTSLGTGSSFTTPVVGNTTSFYAEASVISSGSAIVGAGATTSASYPNPFYSNWSNSHNQYLITASELQASGLTAGNITSLGIKINSGTTALQDFSIKMAPTNATNVSAFLAPAFVSVYSAATITPVVGVNTLTFTTPFPWDGTSNIVIEICQGNSATTATVSSTAEADNTTYVSTIHVHKTSGTSGTNVCTDITSNITTYSVRPRFFFNGQVACASFRQVATATINTAPTFTITNDKTVCNNVITPLSVISAQASYNNVTWSPVAGLFTDAAATVPYVANTHAYTVYHRSAVVGSENYIATAQNTTTMCGGIDTVKVQVIPPAITAIATPGILCVSGSSTIRINPAIPQTGELYQWQSSSDNVTFTNIGSVVTADTLATGNLTATRYFRALVKNSDSVTCFNAVSDTVLVNSPVLTSTTPATRCGIGTVTLQATAASGTNINWFSAATGGTSLGTGPSFTTPTLTASTTYYVEPSIGDPTLHVGPLNNLSTLSYYITNDWGITFNATAPTTVQSIAVYPGSAGTVTIVAKSGTGTGATVFGTYTATFTAAQVGTKVIVPVNFNIPAAGTGYKMLVQSFSSGFTGLHRESVSGFPYTTAGSPVSLTSSEWSGTTTGTFYFFYDWVIGSSCAAPRTAVQATVTPPPAFDITNDKTVCNNTATALTITTGSGSFNNVTWTPAANLYTNAAATTAYVAGTHATTVYYKNATEGITTITANAVNTTTNCVNLDTIKIQTLPASITARANPKQLCESGVAVINYSPAINQTGFTQQWSGSSDNITFADISGATGATYTTPTLTNTRYYRITVKNSDGATCLTSRDTVKVLHPQITQTVPAERCGPGILTLNATAIDGVAKWYAAATGGTALATGNSFNTPNLTNTTTYYVSAGSGKNDTITVGTGTTTSSGYPNPYNKAWGGNRHQYLITAQELTTAGLTAGPIQGLALDIVAISTSGTAAQRTMNDLTVKLGATNNTTMAGGFVPTTSLQTVYNNAGYLPAATGWNYLNFANSYNWDGVSNLLVEFTSNSGNTGGGGAHTIRMSSTTYPATYVRNADNVTPATAAEFYITTSTSGSSAAYSTRANMRFYANTLCEGTRTPVLATIKTVPTAGLTPNGNINLCDGETQTLTASGTGTYTWLRNNAVIGGQTANTLAVTQTDPYKVVVTGSNGCTDTSVVALVNVVPKPVVHLGNDTAVCANETLQLNAGNPGATYQWSNNSTTQTINVTTPGQYVVTVTNNFNCVARDTINVTHLAFPVVDLGADTAICPTQPLTLDAENTGAAYLWNNGTTNQTLVVNQPGAYSVVVTNANNCKGTDTINISFVPAIVNRGFDFEPLFNIQPGRVRFTPIGINPDYTYAWDFGDGNTSNQTITEHDYAASGNYVVQLRVSDGCADSLETLEIKVDLFNTSVTRVNQADLSVKIYPNPTSSVLNVVLESENTYISKLSIFNLIGQNITTIVPANKNTKQQAVHLDNLSSGAYLIKIETDKGTVNRKFEFIK